MSSVIHTICTRSRLFSRDIGAWTRDGMIAMRPHFGHLVILLVPGTHGPAHPQAEFPTLASITSLMSAYIYIVPLQNPYESYTANSVMSHL